MWGEVCIPHLKQAPRLQLSSILELVLLCLRKQFIVKQHICHPAHCRTEVEAVSLRACRASKGKLNRMPELTKSQVNKLVICQDDPIMSPFLRGSVAASSATFNSMYSDVDPSGSI